LEFNTGKRELGFGDLLVVVVVVVVGVPAWC
jgi:hypothetical protein